jgi:HSP20 family protein
MLVFRFNTTVGRFEITGVAGEIARSRTGFKPPVDISLTDRIFCIRMDIPGVSPENIFIEADEHLVNITGTIQVDEPPGPCRLMERHSGSFTRKLKFPDKIVPDKVEAQLENGVLTLKIPAPGTARASTVIEIQVEGAD